MRSVMSSVMSQVGLDRVAINAYLDFARRGAVLGLGRIAMGAVVDRRRGARLIVRNSGVPGMAPPPIPSPQVAGSWIRLRGPAASVMVRCAAGR